MIINAINLVTSSYTQFVAFFFCLTGSEFEPVKPNKYTNKQTSNTNDKNIGNGMQKQVRQIETNVT